MSYGELVDLSDHDMHHILLNLGKDTRDLMKMWNLYVGGGYIRSIVSGEPVNDVDMFAGEVRNLEAAAKLAAASRDGKEHKTANAITVLSPPRIPLQMITRWVFPDLVSCVESFDYTVCQAAIHYDMKEGRWVGKCSKYFYPDLAARRLVYTAPKRDEDSGGSILRMTKFLRRGYNIQIGSLAKVIARLLEGGSTSPMWQGDETAKAMIITSLLTVVDPMVTIDGFDIVNDHEVIS